MTTLAQEISKATKGRSVQEVAKEWGLDYWLLRDIMSGKAKSPRVEHLPALARGLGMTVEELVHKIALQGDGDSRPRQEVPA